MQLERKLGIRIERPRIDLDAPSAAEPQHQPSHGSRHAARLHADRKSRIGRLPGEFLQVQA
jgi:hypothetical protein